MSAILKMCVPFLAYFTLLDQKRKQTLGGIGIESTEVVTFIVDTFLCLAYFTLLYQKRKQSLGGIGIESKFEIYLMAAESVLHGEKTSYGPDFRGDFFHPTRFISFLSY